MQKPCVLHLCGAEGPDSGIIVLIQERHAVVGLHGIICRSQGQSPGFGAAVWNAYLCGPKQPGKVPGTVGLLIIISMTMKKFVLMLAAAMVVMGLGVSCDKDKIQKDDTKPSSGETGVTSLSGTTWSTASLAGIGTLTLTFTSTDCTLTRDNEGSRVSCTYPYTFNNGTMKTKGKLANDVEQDLTGTVSGSNMNVVFSKSGNYIFSKK